MSPPGLPRLHEIGVDGNVALFTLAVSLAAGLLFGSVPVFKYAGVGLGIGLREGGRSMSESRERHRSRGVLVIVQVALGAGKSEVLKMVIGQGIQAGIDRRGIGQAGRTEPDGFLSGLLYGVKPGKLTDICAVSALLMSLALFASYIPARHAPK